MKDVQHGYDKHTTPIQIGERLRAKLWAEAIELAAEYERTNDHHRRQQMHAQFDALLELLSAAFDDDRLHDGGDQ